MSKSFNNLRSTSQFKGALDGALICEIFYWKNQVLVDRSLTQNANSKLDLQSELRVAPSCNAVGWARRRKRVRYMHLLSRCGVPPDWLPEFGTGGE